MLEPYVLKDTRTVLRRGGESNLSNLSDNDLSQSIIIDLGMLQIRIIDYPQLYNMNTFFEKFTSDYNIDVTCLVANQLEKNFI